VRLAWKRIPRFGVPELFALAAAASFLAARFLPVLGAGPGCPFRAVTGLPCATCGMTHAFVALAQGQLADALAASPAGALLAAAAWIYAPLALGRAALGLPWPVLPPRAWRAMAASGAGAIALSWAWMLLAARAG
jgi:hypothetical protein